MQAGIHTILSRKRAMGGAPYIGPRLGDRPIPGIRGISVAVRCEKVPR